MWVCMTTGKGTTEYKEYTEWEWGFLLLFLAFGVGVIWESGYGEAAWLSEILGRGFI